MQLDDILDGLSKQGRSRLLLSALQKGIVSDEKYFVEVVSNLTKEGDFSAAEEIARNLGYKGVSERLIGAEIAGAYRREAHGAAERIREKKLAYPDEIKETPKELRELLENTEKMQAAVRRADRFSAYQICNEDGSAPGPTMREVKDYKKFLKWLKYSIIKTVSKLKEHGHPCAAAEILETVLSHETEIRRIVSDSKPGETIFKWQNLLIDCYVDANKLLKAGAYAADEAKTYKKIVDAEWNKDSPEEKTECMKVAIHFSQRAYELFERGEGWKEAIELARCMGDRKREELYLSLVDFLKLPLQDNNSS